MIEPEFEDILTVLAVGIFADKKIISTEMQVFIRSVSSVQLSTLDLNRVSGARALSWFEMNKDFIREKFDGPRPEFDAWLIPILERISQHVDKDEFKKLLNEIFLADDELHISESAMTVLVNMVWDKAA